ncbi:hypothetical protein [Ruegeria arenilitoris]|uniref:hypothetical protein n=1 Tax=Ruegeria arenilitoris TaxID=1173585 RepID=UPI00148049BC|nr:hypothetical protein [Ruegeria arenilitoris]
METVATTSSALPPTPIWGLSKLAQSSLMRIPIKHMPTRNPANECQFGHLSSYTSRIGVRLGLEAAIRCAVDQ